LKRYQKFAILWAVNSALLYLAAMFVPVHYTLGNNMFTSFQAALFTGFVWNHILWHAESMFKDLEIKAGSPMSKMLTYLILNFGLLWLLARFAFLTGFGVSSYMYVLVLALVGNFVQYSAWRMMDKK